MEKDDPAKTSWSARILGAWSRWIRRWRPEPPIRTLDLSPRCSVCGTPSSVVVLDKYADGWRLVFQGVDGSRNGAGDPISEERSQAIQDALNPPYEPGKIQAAGFYDDFGYCTPCEAFYCGTHWSVSTTGLGTCPAGHSKSLDPHWHPDGYDL